MTPKEEFLSLCRENIKRDGMEDLLAWLEKSDFFEAPASSRFHGSYPGGLCDHSLNVYRELQRLRKAYPEVKMTDETAVIISLFHDAAKIRSYRQEKRNRKGEDGRWEEYLSYRRDEKFKFGVHGAKSMFLVQNFMKLTPEEAVAIVNHMGAFDNEHVGDAFEAFPIAALLHFADAAATWIIEGKE